jgi:hypothetical protein
MVAPSIIRGIERIFRRCRAAGIRANREDAQYFTVGLEPQKPRSAHRSLEDDEHGELLVADESMLGARRHEDRLALVRVDAFGFDE